MIVSTRPELLFWKPVNEFHESYRNGFLNYVRKGMEDPAIAAYRFSCFASKSLLVPPDFDSRVSYVEGIEITRYGPRYLAWNQVDQSHLGFLSSYKWMYNDVSTIVPLIFCQADKIKHLLPFRSGFERRKRFAEYIWSLLPVPDYQLRRRLNIKGVLVENPDWEIEFQLNLCAIYKAS